MSSVAAFVCKVMVGSAEVFRLSFGPVGDSRLVLTIAISTSHGLRHRGCHFILVWVSLLTSFIFIFFDRAPLPPRPISTAMVVSSNVVVLSWVPGWECTSCTSSAPTPVSARRAKFGSCSIISRDFSIILCLLSVAQSISSHPLDLALNSSILISSEPFSLGYTASRFTKGRSILPVRAFVIC